MQKDQEHHAYTNSGRPATPDPPTALHLRLIVLGHRTTLLPPRPRAKSKWQSQAPNTPALHPTRSEEHTSELQSRLHLVCRLLLEKKKEPTGVDTSILP